MNAAAVVQAIERNTRQLMDEVNGELRTNLGTSHYHRLSEEQLVQRGSAVFQGLTQWLARGDEAALQKYGEALGARRFNEGTPLGQVVLAMILIEKQIWTFLGGSGEQVEEEAQRAITECFQKVVYYTAKGYEASLAVSNRMARRAAVVNPPPKKEPAKDEQEQQISRGGQVGELGG